jgi:hypothetical protein
MIRPVLRRALRITGRVIAALLCCISLPLCAAAAVLWVRGYTTVDVFELVDYRSRQGDTTNTIYRVSSGRGVLVFTYTRRFSTWYVWPPGSRPPPPDFGSRRYVHVALRPDQFRLARRTIWQRLGFNGHWNERTRFGTNGPITLQNIDRGFRLPCWVVVLATGVLPVIYLRRLGVVRRRYRSRRGLCPKCGYDLRASRERCPECGEAIPAPSAVAAAPATMGVAT